MHEILSYELQYTVPWRVDLNSRPVLASAIAVYRTYSTAFARSSRCVAVLDAQIG